MINKQFKCLFGLEVGTQMTNKPRNHELNDAAAVAAHYGEPSVLAREKTMTRLDKYARQFIACAPFMVMATASADGDLDASPKGDAPGFVRIIDDVTLAIPDRPGNRRVDGAYNIVATGRIGMLFMIPGMNETLRVNGRASMTTDPTLLEQLLAQGKLPVAACRVEVDEVFLHCAKALVRSKLWDSDRHIDRTEFPPLGHMISEQIGADDLDGAEAMVQDSLKNKLY